VLDEQLIYQIDTPDMKSINGVRVADKILSLVPDCGVFRRATRFVKFFASQRCVYSNAIGYVGGVSWALMVGRICQLYPNANALEIVLRFYEIFSSKWEWERNAVVQLGHIVDAPLNHVPRERQGQFREWNNNKYPNDASNPFPVITPIFPCHNTAYNVTESQKWCMLQEIGRGWRIFRGIAEIICGSDEGLGGMMIQTVVSDLRRTLEEVCEPYGFFTAFTKYLVVEVSGTTEMVFTKLKGLVESRMRSLVKTLEDYRVYSRPHQGFFQDTGGELVGSFYLGIWTDTDDMNPEVAVDLNEPIKIFYSETIAKSLVGLDWFDGGNVRIHVKAVDRDNLIPPTAPQSKRMRAD
jgi:poly(A) polymerase